MVKNNGFSKKPVIFAQMRNVQQNQKREMHVAPMRRGNVEVMADIIKCCTPHSPVTQSVIRQKIQVCTEQLSRVLPKLVEEGLVIQTMQRVPNGSLRKVFYHTRKGLVTADVIKRLQL